MEKTDRSHLYQLHPRSSDRRGGRLLLGLVLTLFILSIIGAALWFSRGLWSKVTALVPVGTQDAAGLRVAQARTSALRIRELSDSHEWRGVTLPISNEIGVLDYATAGDVEVAILREGSNELVVFIKDWKVVVNDAFPKRELTISPDGAIVAFAMQVGDRDRGFLSAPGWEVWTIDTATGTLTRRGRGFGPGFFVREGAAYLYSTSPDGLHVVNLENGATAHAAITLPTIANHPLVVSPDGTYMAVYEREAKTYSFHTLSFGEGGIAYQQSGRTTPNLADLMWQDGILFGLGVPLNGSTVLWKIDPQSTQPPESVSVIPGPEQHRFIEHL